MKIIGYAVLLLLIGVGGYVMGKKGGAVNHSEEGSYKERYRSLKNKLSTISEVDIEEYLLLKDQKEKYQKADEILGKMMSIFLADLGLRISAQKISDVQEHLSDVHYQKSQVKSNTHSVNSKSVRSATNNGNNQTGQSQKKGNGWVKNEAKTSELVSDSEITDFLKSVEVDEAFEQLKSSEKINKFQFTSIEGVYLGRVDFTDRTKVSWDVEMEIDGVHVREKGIEGTSLVKLSKNGKPFSTSTGKGVLKGFRSFGGSSKAILVNCNGGDGFFQLYAVSKIGKLVGNYYHKISVGNFQKTGTVILEPR